MAARRGGLLTSGRCTLPRGRWRGSTWTQQRGRTTGRWEASSISKRNPGMGSSAGCIGSHSIPCPMMATRSSCDWKQGVTNQSGKHKRCSHRHTPFSSPYLCLPSHDGFFPVELNCVRAYKRYCARMEEKFGVRFLIVGSHVGDISVGGWAPRG